MPRPPKPPPPRGPRSPGPPGPRPNVPPAPGPPAPAFAASAFLPKPKVLLRRRLREKRPALVNESMGTMGSPAWGTRLNEPYLLVITLCGLDWLVANDGRSLKIESPFRSSPVVIL